jgi:peptide/nickel transport system substrate-binding protein
LKGLAAALAVAAVSVTAQAIAAQLPLRIALNADIRGLEPGVNRDANTDLVIHHIVEGLVAHRADMSIGPVLADSWTVSPDGRTYTFKLRKGVRFHNGAPLTSAEVKWSWQRYLAPDSAWACKGWFDGSASGTDGGLELEAVETPDAQTVVFELDRPSGLFLAQLASIQCPSAVLHPSSLDASGKWRQPIATGPYRLAQWRRGQYVELARFDGYVPRKEPRSGYAGAREPNMERLRFVVVPEEVAAVAALRAGSIDVVQNVGVDQIAALSKDRNLAIAHQSLLGWTVLLLNTRDPVLKDERVRRAVAHAIERSQIVKANTGGYAKVNSSAVPVDSSFYSPAHRTWHAYDVARARALLRAAGYRGAPLRIQTNRRYKNMYDNALMIQAMLQSAGIRAELDVMDWASQLSRYQQGKFQLSSFSFSARLDPAFTYANLIGDKAERGNVQWEDPTARQLLEKLVKAPEADGRKAIMEQLHRRMVAQVPVIGLYNGHWAIVTRADVKDVMHWPAGTLAFWGVTRASR